MNKTMLIGRLTRDPEVRYSETGSVITRYTLAVNRNYKQENDKNDNKQTADFICCVCFGNAAVVAQKHLTKGMKIAVTGHIQTGSYVNKNGVKIRTTDVVVESHDFCESKSKSKSTDNQPAPAPSDNDGFMNIPDRIDEELPFN